jgi:hypothetical protein
MRRSGARRQPRNGEHIAVLVYTHGFPKDLTRSRRRSDDVLASSETKAAQVKIGSEAEADLMWRGKTRTSGLSTLT